MIDAKTSEAAPLGTVQILLVEDSPADVYLVEMVLQHFKIAYHLRRYADGEKAINALNNEDYGAPDIILLDLNLPRRGGAEVLDVVRGKPDLAGIPVGILSSSEYARDRHRLGLTETERYIHKAPSLEEFMNRVGNAIQEMVAAAWDRRARAESSNSSFFSVAAQIR